MIIKSEWEANYKQIIRWSDIDQYGYLTSSAYINIAIEARAYYFYNEIKKLQNVQLITKNVNINLNKPILYHDNLSIKLKLLEQNSTSFDLLALFIVNEVVHGEVATKLVTYCSNLKKVIKIPEDYRKKLSELGAEV